MSEYRAIKTELLAEALAIVSPRVDSWKRAAAHYAGMFVGEERHEISEAFVRAVVENIEEAEPGCDHSVGICMCGARQVLEDLRLWLDHKERCPVCNGDGFYYSPEVWSQAMSDYKMDAYRQRTENPPDENAGYVQCPVTVAI